VRRLPYAVAVGLHAPLLAGLMTLTAEDLHQLKRELEWASRVNPQSPSRKTLRRWFERSDVLDLLEHLLDNYIAVEREE